MNIIDPELKIVDAHHHLFDLPGLRYLGDEMLSDVESGHNVIATVYCETKAFLRSDGPELLRPLGEVEFANGVGAVHASGRYGKARLCAGVVGYVDLTLGSAIGELLDRCMSAAPDRYRGVRQVTIDYPDERPFRYIVTHRPPSGLLDHPLLLEGLAEVDRRGLSFDAAIFDPSLPRIAQLADRFPNLTIVLNHMGTAVGIDMNGHEKADVFRRWSHNLRDLAQRPNVLCKIGGLGMPMWGFRFEERTEPASCDELAWTWKPYIDVAIEAFGPNRCMMESNFPPDRRSCNYLTLWNALKLATQDYSSAERNQLFHKSAISAYRLSLQA